MKKIIKIIIIVNLLMINFVSAEEYDTEYVELLPNQDVLTIDMGDNVLRFQNEYGIDEFMILDDGRIMMKINGVYEEVAYVNDSHSHQYAFADLISSYSAPSQFLLSTSKTGIQVKINANVISMGKIAVKETLVAIVSSLVTSDKIKMTALSISIAASLAEYIVNNYETYEVNCTRKSYVYNGCTWLIYDEICFPGGYDIGGYIWLDNPALGVAPTTCKLASQTYPY